MAQDKSNTKILLLAATAVVLLNICLFADTIHVHRAPCIDGKAIGEAGILINTSRGLPGKLCEE